ncbi:hypothetical protein OAS39_02255 [Pirellulales bacterium]|nr:hypothetical protein [Pirellulales bacterium]
MDSLEAYRQHVPPRSNYAYDLIVEVGLARFRDHRQDREIEQQLQAHWGLSLPSSSLGQLAHSFLDGLAALHQAHIPALREYMAQRGGYALHLDGTCEPGTDVLFTALAEPFGWTLEVAKMSSENKVEISRLVRSCVGHFGEPLAVMRDLSKNIANAKQEVLPDVPDLICHYHFLENVGTKLCQKPHGHLTSALRRLKVRPALKSLRNDLVRWNKKGEPFSAEQIDDLLRRPEAIEELDQVALRRLAAYLLLRWLDDFGADLRGEYFPFDLPSLAFYRRGRRLEDLLSQLVASENFPQRELTTLKTIACHLGSLREDDEVLAAAERLEKASALFEELRDVLRLSSASDPHVLRGRAIRNDRGFAERLKKRLDRWREQLRKRQDRERDPDQHADQEIVLGYLEKYKKELVGHVIVLPDRQKPFVVARTNNPAEHRFAFTKQGVRRKVGVKKLTRYVQAMRPEELLTANLSDPQYLEIVCAGTLSNLAPRFAQHWSKAQAIRVERQKPNRDHPMPTSKKQLRSPQLLNTVKQTINAIVHALSEKTDAA